MSIAAPDAQGFIAAQDQLRRQLGGPATLYVPVAPAWPSGTRMNPDSGLPYDPMVVRTNAEFTEATITGLVIVKQGSPLRPQADTRVEAAGELSGMDIIMDFADEDWEAHPAASRMRVAGLLYQIEEAKPFSLAGVKYRYLVYGQEK